ncbi:hypothetical protein [Pengzhenrongella sicca]|uniref:Uncharacterized protein n=1 Tax=Pengzhenrongella sicca TaxID=2819238 RepID=A0A8A4ZIG4_9MICO|nr:hypothetical protein [Pengzhenrongella sicca]QTE30793.1 hypothetical protein J4E96_07630 [Pengzhenrongella sicca]
MSTSSRAADPTDPAGSPTAAAADPPAEPALDGPAPGGAEPSDEPVDVRSGGDAGNAPRSLTAAEARWQEHESSGSSWDAGDTI